MFRTGLMTTAAVAVVWGLTSGVISAAETKKSDAQLCLGALAGGGAETNADARLQKLDTDGNGFVSSEEFQNCLSDMFAKLDANADDRLSADELEKGHASMMQNMAGADKTKADTQMTADTKAKADADKTKADTQLTADTKAKADADKTTADTQLTADTKAKVDADKTKADTQLTADTKAKADADKTKADTQVTADTKAKADADKTKADTQVTADTKAKADADKTQLKADSQTTTQTGQPAVGTTDQAAVEPSQPLSEIRISAEELIGKSVANPSGENLGEIEDLVIDPANEDMFAVVGVGGFLGLGEKKVTIPYNDLQMSADNDKVLIMTAQTKEQLKQMPEYEKDRFRPVRAQ